MCHCDSLIRNDPSQFDANFSLVDSFLSSPLIFDKRRPSMKDLGLTRQLYKHDTICLVSCSWILALPLSSFNRFSLLHMHCLLRSIFVVPLLKVGSLTALVRLYGDSPINNQGVHRYVHKTSNSSFIHFPLATPVLLFNSLNMILLANSTWSLVYKCSVEAIMCFIPRLI